MHMSTKPLEGIKIIDFTHVQAGPACTQLLAWFGADVIKVERPGSGDVTRSQLRDIPDADALYFTMLNSNKRSLTLDTKKPEGKMVLEKLIRESDVLVENFGPGALDRMGFTWERINELNPKMIVASVKGFSDGHHYEDLKVYENVAQCAGGAASTTGWWKGENSVPTISAAALGDRHPDGDHRPREDRQGPEGGLLDAGRGAEPVPGQDARPAASGQPGLP
jgi:formyl-CoA transferase